ncbi:MAG: hypothetical protein IKX62_00525 [Bacteroidales bacterium]|nr:hypothetical protein [Bacteroidales bacterium]
MRKWIHRALKGASLTTALFVFQACYGTPPGPYDQLEAADETELVEQTPADDAGELEEEAVLAEAE